VRAVERAVALEESGLRCDVVVEEEQDLAAGRGDGGIPRGRWGCDTTRRGNPVRSAASISRVPSMEPSTATTASNSAPAARCRSSSPRRRARRSRRLYDGMMTLTLASSPDAMDHMDGPAH
jgi:hypothetical protein